MGLTTYLNPDVIKDGDISASKISAISKSITWSGLKTLRDGSKLIPGMQYRITDYQCTTIQENTRSANHQFDIIVTADSEGVLNEEARAIIVLISAPSRLTRRSTCLRLTVTVAKTYRNCWSTPRRWNPVGLT